MTSTSVSANTVRLEQKKTFKRTSVMTIKMITIEVMSWTLLPQSQTSTSDKIEDDCNHKNNNESMPKSIWRLVELILENNIMVMNPEIMNLLAQGWVQSIEIVTLQYMMAMNDLLHHKLRSWRWETKD